MRFMPRPYESPPAAGPTSRRRAPWGEAGGAARGSLTALGLTLLLATPADAQTCKVLLPIGNGNDVGTAVAVQSDGKIVLAGYSFIAASDDFAVARFNSDFSIDRSFDADGVVTTGIGAGQDRAEAMAIQSDGKIVAAGHSDGGGTNNDFALVRYNPDGSLDGRFPLMACPLRDEREGDC